MSQDFFEYHIETMKEKYPTFGKYQNYHIFTLLCIKYFFYSESGISFDQDVIEEFLTDGANDGGIDAIFNDPTSEGNDLIIVQSKFYENTALVIGNEGSGVSRLVKKESDVLVSIPMNQNVESLNASVAASILIYHMGANE